MQSNPGNESSATGLKVPLKGSRARGSKDVYNAEGSSGHLTFIRHPDG
jgi:hypothetical protein